MIDNTVIWIRNNAKFPVMAIETVLVENFINLTKKCLIHLTDEEKVPYCFDNVMIFSLVWSIGAAMDEIYRPNFSKFINKLISGAKMDLPTIF